MRVAPMPHLDKHKGLWRVRIVMLPKLQAPVGRLTGKPAPIKVLLRSTGTGDRDEVNRIALEPVCKGVRDWFDGLILRIPMMSAGHSD
jgi:hypothetical protein